MNTEAVSLLSRETIESNAHELKQLIPPLYTWQQLIYESDLQTGTGYGTVATAVLASLNAWSFDAPPIAWAPPVLLSVAKGGASWTIDSWLTAFVNAQQILRYHDGTLTSYNSSLNASVDTSGYTNLVGPFTGLCWTDYGGQWTVTGTRTRLIPCSRFDANSNPSVKVTLYHMASGILMADGVFTRPATSTRADSLEVPLENTGNFAIGTMYSGCFSGSCAYVKPGQGAQWQLNAVGNNLNP